MKYVVDIKGELPKTGALRNAQPLSITSEIDDIAGEFCDNYCKWPHLTETETELYNLHCIDCPFNRL